MNAVHCRDLKKEFGSGQVRVLALRGVDLKVRFGETTFLVGPSGCGKTTLLSVIAGLLDSSGGEVELFGENVERFRPEQRILFRRKNLGFVFQQYNLLPALTAAENAAVPLFAAGIKRREAIAQAKELLVQLGLEDRLDALPRTLSGGSNNASRSPARLCTIRALSSATSRPPRSTTRPARTEAPAPPPESPFSERVAGVGLVEASTENVAIGTHIAGIVARVCVSAGQRVSAGDELFEIDSCHLHAQLELQRAALAVVEAELADLQNQLSRSERLAREKVISSDELDRHRFATRIAEARVAEAAAAIKMSETEIARSRVTAPV